MASRRTRRRGGGRGLQAGSAHVAAATRTARVGETIRRIVASELELIEDDRLDLVSITSVEVDRALHRAVVWFTTLEDDSEEAAAEAFEEFSGVLRAAVGSQARLRHTPRLEFRPDAVVRSAERIEELLRDGRGSAPGTGGGQDGGGCGGQHGGGRCRGGSGNGH